nr:M14 family metallopeptidase [Sphingopyxis sp. BSNA05]
MVARQIRGRAGYSRAYNSQKETQPLEQVVLIGRQHPPEVTGALAILPFVETLLADTPLAKRYRERFETIVVPMLNPDGVVRGYWRHSTGHVDLNRDWGPFTQPETRLMKDLLDGIEEEPNKNLRLFVDFHSTRYDIFYTIPDDYQTTPPLFLKNWLDLLQQRMPGYEINRDAGHNLGQSNSKNYVHKRYGVPTMTYEMGDETDRRLVRKIAVAAATSMMETLLETETPR